MELRPRSAACVRETLHGIDRSMLRPTANPVQPPDVDCPLSLCVEYISGAWTPQILWYLREGPRRFGDLRRDLSVSAKVLTEHLRALEDRLMVERRVVDTSPRTMEYSLTDFGRRFNPILDAIIALGREIKASRRLTGGASGARRGEGPYATDSVAVHVSRTESASTRMRATSD
jgi:DNA-binding HxlR family transcriptional regulator